MEEGRCISTKCQTQALTAARPKPKPTKTPDSKNRNQMEEGSLCFYCYYHLLGPWSIKQQTCSSSFHCVLLPRIALSTNLIRVHLYFPPAVGLAFGPTGSDKRHPTVTLGLVWFGLVWFCMVWYVVII